MADCLSFLTHAMGNTLYSFLEGPIVAALSETNKEIRENIVTYVAECRKMGKRPYPRAAYFENKKGCGFISYTGNNGPTVLYLGKVDSLEIRKCNPHKYREDKYYLSRSKLVDPYRVIFHNHRGVATVDEFMSREDALAIYRAFDALVKSESAEAAAAAN